MWENCGEIIAKIGELDAHVIAHVVRDNCCRWEGCPGYTAEIRNLLEMHVIRHVYDVSTWLMYLLQLNCYKFVNCCTE